MSTPLGLGRIQEIGDESSIIEFTDVCELEPEILSFPNVDLTEPEWGELLEARLWLRSQEFGWLPGRFTGKLDQGLDVKIRGQYLTVPEYSVWIRWDKEMERCEDALALGMNDSQAFYHARLPVLKNFILQRNICRGYTAALSAPVRIFSHQLNVMARVLGDPIRRFILADEVGLGKTIEAGLITRQILLDDPHAVVIIAVPRLLKRQWEDELARKLLLGDHFDLGTLQVISFDELAEFNYNGVDMLIVDEAHHLAANKELLETAGDVSGLVPGLLLLTATPLRGNTETFYDLLRLVDPDAYPLDGKNRFSERLSERQTEALNIELLDDQTDHSILATVLEEFRETHSTDTYLSSQIDEFNDVDLNEVEVRSEKLRLLRDYLRDTYRISRRVIRNRRSEALQHGFRVSGRAFEIKSLHEPSRPFIDDFLIQYREVMSLGDDQIDSQQRFRSAMEHALAGPEAMLDFVATELELDGANRGLLEQVAASIRLSLAEFEFSDGQISGTSHRWGHVLHECKRQAQTGKGKTIVFTSFSQSAEKFVELLRSLIGPHAVRHHLVSDTSEEQEQAVQEFLYGNTCRVLVCDHSAEEGRNLQSSQRVFHLDVPLSINRLEQRIGRTDRFSEAGSRSSNSVIFDEPDSELVTNYMKLLTEAVGIFDKSVATLHHPLADLEMELQQRSLDEGFAVFVDDLDGVREALETETELIEYLELVESSSTHSDLSPLHIEELREFEEASGDIKEAFDLLVNADGGLKLRPRYEENNLSILSYKPVDHNAHTLPLVRLDQFLEIAHEFPKKRTFNRVAARKTPDVALMRLGDPLVDWLESYLRMDDRGRARVLWAHKPSYKQAVVFFKFDFQIEFNDEELKSKGFPMLRRRGDVFFPPLTREIWVANGKVAEGEMEQKFNALDTRPWTNIRGERWRFVHEALPNWKTLCEESGQLAREKIIDKESIKEALVKAKQLSEEDARRRSGILSTRLERSEIETEQVYLGTELEKELAILEGIEFGIQQPVIRMIAAGAHIWSPIEIPKED